MNVFAKKHRSPAHVCGLDRSGTGGQTTRESQADLNKLNTLQHKHFRLRTLGGLTLDLPGGAEDRELATRRRKLAVLAYLAIVDKPVARATLIELFWGDQPEERARHSLSDTLSSLRRVLGSAAISARLADVQLDSVGAGLSIDARELAQAAADGRHADVVALYEGPFLPAFAVPGSQTFDVWVEQERLRLSKLFSRSCRALCLEYERQNDWASSLALGLRWLEADPLSTGAQLAVLRGHAADGTPDALKTARQEFRQLEQRLSRDFGALPDRDVRELVESWQQRLNDAGVGSSIAPTAAPSAPAATPAGFLARTPRWAFGVGAVAVVAVIAVAWSNRAKGAVDPRPVIVADVENQTGDSVFDRTVSVALASALAQSPHARVVAPAQINRALVRMRRPDNDPKLNEALAREVAQRDGVPVVVVPSVHSAGSAYELTTKIVDAASGAVISFAAVRSNDRAGVLNALDQLGQEVRRGLGETARSIRSNNVPLPLATTSSLEALKMYAEGQRAYNMARLDDAERLWTGAVALDTNFAKAYAALGMLAYRSNRPMEGDSLYARALARLGTLTEREQVTIRSSAVAWRGDHAASVALLEGYLAKNPQDLDVMGALAYEYLLIRRLAEGAAMYRRVLSIDSLDYTGWINLATIESARDSMAASLRAYGHVRRIAPMLVTANDNVNLEYAIAFVKAGHLDSAAILIAELAAMPDDLRRARALRSQSYLNAFAGRFAEASTNLSDAIVLNQKMKSGTSEIRNRLLLATLQTERGLPRDAAVQLDSAFAVTQRIDAEATIIFWVGKALARSGDTRRTSVLLARLERMARPDSPVHRGALAGLRAELQVANRDAASALTLLKPIVEAGGDHTFQESTAYAAMSAGRFDEAVAMYERLAAKLYFGTEGQHHARLAAYWLGRVREREGKPELARAAYERFLAEWTQPDSTLRSVIDARTRLEQLRRGGRGG